MVHKAKASSLLKAVHGSGNSQSHFTTTNYEEGQDQMQATQLPQTAWGICDWCEKSAQKKEGFWEVLAKYDESCGDAQWTRGVGFLWDQYCVVLGRSGNKTQVSLQNLFSLKSGIAKWSGHLTHVQRLPGLKPAPDMSQSVRREFTSSL